MAHPHMRTDLHARAMIPAVVVPVAKERAPQVLDLAGAVAAVTAEEEGAEPAVAVLASNLRR